MKNWKQLVVKHLFPNMGTVMIVALLILTQNVGANETATPMLQGSAPTLISYQGTLTDSNGSSIEGDINMTFSLYREAEGGTPIWTETYENTQAISVRDGQFHVLLGSQVALDTVDIGGNLYLGIVVNGEEMLPRELLTGVVYAKHADMIDGNHASDFLSTDGGTLTGGLDINSAEGFSFGRVTFSNGNVSSNPIIGTSGSALILRPAIDDQPDSKVVIMDGNTQRHIQFHAGGSLAINGFVDMAATQPMEIRLQTNGAETGIYGSLNMHGNSVSNCGALTEANLQTPEELAAERVDRFEEGDVLCWMGEQLEKCETANDVLVQAVADVDGRPIVIGAEVIKVLGPVQMGDILVASDVPGYAMVNNDPRPGTVIAQALEGWGEEQGIIKAMIRKW